MEISGIEKVTLTDYPNHLAAIIFTQGCNYKCPFCQNSSLIKKGKGLLKECEVLNYLNKRKNILEGLVISGGEPTLQKDLKEFIIKVRKMGLKIKLDTNGNNYSVLEELVNEKLVDYIAMDIKNSLEDYNIVAGVKTNKENIKKSIKLLKKAQVPYEFRTTIVKEFHNLEKIENILKMIGESPYYLQNFQDSEGVLDKSLHSFTPKELKEIANELNKYPNVKIRGFKEEGEVENV